MNVRDWPCRVADEHGFPNQQTRNYGEALKDATMFGGANLESSMTRLVTESGERISDIFR